MTGKSFAMVLAALGLALASVSSVSAQQAPGATNQPAAPHAKRPHAPGHKSKPEVVPNHISQHVRLSPAGGQNIRGSAYLKRDGSGSLVAVEARGLTPGQTYTVQADTAPRCGAGTLQAIGTVKSGASHIHAQISTSRKDVQSIALKNAGSQVVACGTVRHHKGA